jgi:hypothetical protein
MFANVIASEARQSLSGTGEIASCLAMTLVGLLVRKQIRKKCHIVELYLVKKCIFAENKITTGNNKRKFSE